MSERDQISRAEAERLLRPIGALLNQFLLQEPETSDRPLRYNPLDYAILRALEIHDGVGGSELAREFGVARTTLQSALDRLVRIGLVEKKAREGGGRVVGLHLTKEGRTMRSKIHENDLANMKAILASLSKEERAIMLPLIERAAGLEPMGEEPS